MSVIYSPKLQDVKLESLQTQLEHLNLLRLRHRQWMITADDPGVAAMHAGIAAQLEEITAKYNSLLGGLQREKSETSRVAVTYV